MAEIIPGSDEWLDQVTEPIIDPERIIVDPHHHLWREPDSTYVLDHLWADTGSGHNISMTVFMECGQSYCEDGPEHLRPVSETVFVEEIAAQSREGGGAVISAIVSRADLRLAELDEVLDAHMEAGKGIFRGIRHKGAHALFPEELSIPIIAPEGLYQDEDFRRGVARLGERGLTYDAWHYHHQNAKFRDLAEAVPGTKIILDHFGTPVGVGTYANKREEIFAAWKDDIAAIAECPNVVAKIGGLAMPDNGFGWNKNAVPPSSDEFVEAQARYYHHTIESFGPDRCMFESNFPIDRPCLSYHVLYNGLKKIASKYTEEEQNDMFYGVASRVYALD